MGKSLQEIIGKKYVVIDGSTPEGIARLAQLQTKGRKVVSWAAIKNMMNMSDVVEAAGVSADDAKLDGAETPQAE